MKSNPEQISVENLFNEYKYIVPIYQRNYAWKKEEIEQLIFDIYKTDGTYYLGNLIVNHNQDDLYEVIDGQQRLTTLFLLKKFLGCEFSSASLCFESRDKSNRTLSKIDDNYSELNFDEIVNGYKILYFYFITNKIEIEDFKNKLKNVSLVQVQVPKGIDLNHYFEVMNTRGEQLELHEILKAKILKLFEKDIDSYGKGAMIWDACSDMNSYVQMNFSKDVRNALFSGDWSSFSVTDFNDLVSKININEKDTDKKSLLDIIKENKIKSEQINTDDDENERFESAISFPNFLLQVNAVMQSNKDEKESLSDKNFLKKFECIDSKKCAEEFLFNLLKLRVLFDKYIIKREYAKTYKETGKWSLQKLEKYTYENKNKYSPKYKATYSTTDNVDEDSDDNKRLRTLQSCLRVTYTSPRTMYWITETLIELNKNENTDLIGLLERYCVEKLKGANYKTKSGFEFERIVFTYLDYLLYRDGYKSEKNENFQFQFRNSIEHFQPQNPIDECKKWENDGKQDILNSFGNLALITVSGNSKFSNLDPISKIKSYPSVIEQSLKLQVMKKMIGNGTWTKELVQNHSKEMFDILDKEMVIDDVHNATKKRC